MTPCKTVPAGRRRPAAWLAAVLAAGLVTGCAAGASPHPPAAAGRSASRIAVPPGSQARVPRPDYTRAASVAAAFYVAWASTDAVHDQPGT